MQSGESRRRRTQETRMSMARKIKWYVIEEVTVSSDGVRPQYRVSSEREMGPVPPAWLADHPGFASRDDAVQALSELRDAASTP
jgi:hypothetical protein